LIGMFSGRQYILIITGMIAISLGIIGGMSYPLVNNGILSIILYESLIILGVSGLLLLINARGLEED